jgi:hypothetical protein
MLTTDSVKSIVVLIAIKSHDSIHRLLDQPLPLDMAAL